MIFRSSSIGNLMVESRSKSEVLSETAKTYIQKIFKEKELGIYEEINSKYLTKGIENEDIAIQMAAEAYDWDFVTKNTERFTNDFVTGEPDILTDTLLADVKCSWNAKTFPMFDAELKNKMYFWQLQCYLWLTGHETSELVYVLTNTPHEIVEDEVRREHWKANLIEENLDLRDAIQKMHNFDHLPLELRVKRFIVQRDEKAIEKIKEKVEHANTYYETLREIFN